MHLPPFKLERFFAPYEFSVEYVLCASDCESMTVAELLALEPGAAERFSQHWLGYTESQGSPGLRREISRMYTHIEPDDVLVFSGAEEGIFCYMHALLAPGDHVLVHWPCYQSLSQIAASLGCEVERWEARPENGWALDLDELRRRLRSNTRLVVLNTPHNPTGYLMPAAEFAALNQLAQERGFFLFSDEVYRESEHDPALRLPAASDLGPHAASLGVLSKTYGLPGLRIGWVAVQDRALLERMAQVKDYTTICSSAPSEFLAAVALRHRETLAARSLDTIRANLELLGAFFARHPDRFEWQRPLAGPIAFPHLLQDTVTEFCERLVEQAGILLLPGPVFDHPGNHFRIGFGRRTLPPALARLESFLMYNEPHG